MLLDTDVISATRKPDRNADIVAWLKRCRPDGVRLPSPVLAELSFGIARVEQPDKRAELEAWLNSLLGAEEIVPFAAAAAVLFGRMLAHPNLKAFWNPAVRGKRPRFAADLQMAAMAINRGEPIATLNIRHFAQIKAAFPALHFTSPRPPS